MARLGLTTGIMLKSPGKLSNRRIVTVLAAGNRGGRGRGGLLVWDIDDELVVYKWERLQRICGGN